MDDIIETIEEIDNLCIARSIECDLSELYKHTQANKTDLKIISQNIRSIYGNFDDFLTNISCLKFDADIIILTECRLNKNKPIPLLANYSSYNTTRQLNQNDGVAIYIKNYLKHKIKEINLTHASCLQLEVLNNIVLCVYRSPSNTNTEGFINSLNAHLQTLNTKSKNLVIAGDINLNIKPKYNEFPYEYKNRHNYLNMLAEHGVLPGHILPTREKTCLDHYMLRLNQEKFSAFVAVLHTTITDHYTIFLSISKQKIKYNINKVTTKIDFDKAVESLLNANLSELLFCDNPNLLTYQLQQKLIDSMNKNTITTHIPKSKRIIKPWITPGILRCIKNRNKLQKQLRRDPFNQILKITYSRYRNYCNNLIKKIKRKYDRELLAKSTKNNKLLWKNIKLITYTNKTKKQNNDLLNSKSSPNEVTEHINKYFTNIGKELAQKIQSRQKQDPSVYIRGLETHPSSFVIMDTDPEEVYRVLINLKSNSAPGYDQITTKYLKHAGKEIVPIISHLANLCFAKGVFPDQLKRSIVTPVFKDGERDDISNYRPISVLPAISKILEKLINTRLIN